MLNQKTINGRFLFIFFCSLILSLLLNSPLLAAEKAVGDNYILKADDIIFMQQDGIVLFEGSASFKTDDFEIKSDKFTVDTAAKTIVSEQEVVILSAEDNFYGSALYYNYGNEEGELYGGRGDLGELNFSGKIFKILSVSPIEAEIESAQITPCIREEPHYHYKAEKVRINNDNTMDIYHIVPYIGKIPIFYLPYYSVNYNPNNGEEELGNTYPFPKFGYDNERGITVEFNYPYQINDKNGGVISYLTEGREFDRYEKRLLSNNHKLTEFLTFKNSYHYLYNYDLDQEELENYEEEIFSSLEYSRDKYSLEAGIGKNLLVDSNQNRYLFAAHYNFDNGLNTNFRQEYSFDWEVVKEKHIINYNQELINWNLKYIKGEDYNYYPYLTLDFPPLFDIKSSLETGRVENGGVELNKDRINLDYSLDHSVDDGFFYQLDLNYRLDHYRSSYNSNYHYIALNTGFRNEAQLNKKFSLNTGLFYQQEYTSGMSPLPDDRKEEERLLKPALSLNIKRELEQSFFSIKSNGIYDLDLDDWEEINLRLTQDEDCYSFFINYEFVDARISFGVEI